MSQDFLTALVGVIVLLWNPIKTIAGSVGEMLASRLPQNLHTLLQSFARSAVKEAEQLAKAGAEAAAIPPEERLDNALESVKALLAHYKLTVPDNILRTYIESAVNDLPKTGFNQMTSSSVLQTGQEATSAL